jgi:hypothetical protein
MTVLAYIGFGSLLISTPTAIQSSTQNGPVKRKVRAAVVSFHFSSIAEIDAEIPEWCDLLSCTTPMLPALFAPPRSPLLRWGCGSV